MRRFFVLGICRPVLGELCFHVAAELRDFLTQFLDFFLVRDQNFVHVLQIPLLVHERFLDGDEFGLE